MLALCVVAVTDPAIPDVAAFNGFIALHQQVDIDRLGRQIQVPNYTHVMVGIEVPEKLRQTRGNMAVMLVIALSTTTVQRLEHLGIENDALQFAYQLCTTNNG